MRQNEEKRVICIWAVLFWLLVWQIASMWIDSDILLVSPIKVFFRLCQLISTIVFWKTIFFTLSRIAFGFLLAVLTGSVLAGLSWRYHRISELIAPFLLTVKSVPVASFIILALIWFSSRNLSIFISFLMVLPIIYTNVLSGIRSVDKALLEMAEVFRIPRLRVIRFICLPQIMPFFYSACSISLGLAWKAGVAAEVIGIPKGSVGEQMQQAKVYLDTPDLFAWTLVVVVLSLIFEKIVLVLVKRWLQFNLWLPVTKHTWCAKAGNRSDKRMEKICLSNLSKSFGHKKVFEQLNLTVNSGEISCIMAPSGAGKTTLLRMIMGLETIDSGCITGQKGKRFSAVFQEERLCEYLTAIENIRLVTPCLSVETVRQEMDKLGLQDCFEQPVSELSGGMRRRVSLLRALLAEYDILCLDEPFQGLDNACREQTLAYVKQKTAGKTVLFVTHDKKEALQLDARVIVLSDFFL